MPDEVKTTSKDEEMAQKLMEELKSQGVDVDALQGGVGGAAAAPATPPPTTETPAKPAEPEKKPEPKPETPPAPPGKKEEKKPAETKAETVKEEVKLETTPPQSTPQVTPAVANDVLTTSSDIPVEQLAKQIDKQIREVESGNYIQLKLKKAYTIPILLGLGLIAGLAAWLM